MWAHTVCTQLHIDMDTMDKFEYPLHRNIIIMRIMRIYSKEYDCNDINTAWAHGRYCVIARSHAYSDLIRYLNCLILNDVGDGEDA